MRFPVPFAYICLFFLQLKLQYFLAGDSRITPTDAVQQQQRVSPQKKDGEKAHFLHLFAIILQKCLLERIQFQLNSIQYLFSIREQTNE